MYHDNHSFHQNIILEVFIVTAVKAKNIWNVIKVMQENPIITLIIVTVMFGEILWCGYHGKLLFYYSNGDCISLCMSVKNGGK